MHHFNKGQFPYKDPEKEREHQEFRNQYEKSKTMGRYLDFQKQEKGYEPFQLTRENIRKNIGRQICYVNKRRVDPYRGYYNVEYGILCEVRYSRLFLDDGNSEIDIRDVAECGIQIEIKK